MAKYTGKVKYLNKEHGFGYISLCEDPKCEHGDIRFSVSDPNCQSLRLGDTLTFDIKPGTGISKSGKRCEVAVSVQLKEAVSRPLTNYFQNKTDEESTQATEELKQTICDAISRKTGTSCELHFYDRKMPFRYDPDSDNPWLIGRPLCSLYTETKLMQANIRTESLFTNTISGKDSYMHTGSNTSNSRRVIPVPKYGCPSFFISRDLCFLMIEFACRSGINLSYYEIIFVDNSRTCVYTMTLSRLQQLIQSGYNHDSLGEYPSKPDYKGNSGMRYLLPVDAFEKFPITK